MPCFGYRKLGTLLDSLEAWARPGDAASLLSAIERFGSGVGQWLKVAADAKAQLLDSALGRREARRLEACAELGTFVGYTAVRLARWVQGPDPAPGWGVSLEVDPVHALLTRHNLSLAWLSSRADVWVGQALDLIPRFAEDLGATSLVLAFMDHRGTKFHSDLFRVQRQGVPIPDFTLVCDNTLKPGAPLCLWLIEHRLGQPAASSGNWSLNEFAHWNSEDWMLVAGHPQPRSSFRP